MIHFFFKFVNLYFFLSLAYKVIAIYIYLGFCLPSLSAVRSVSFAGSVLKTDTPWMGEDVKHPMRGLGLSSLCLQEKKGGVGCTCAGCAFVCLCMLF